MLKNSFVTLSFVALLGVTSTGYADIVFSGNFEKKELRSGGNWVGLARKIKPDAKLFLTVPRSSLMQTSYSLRLKQSTFPI